jgi:hypothetical protein
MRHVWLYISSFGVMFAVLSWLQESELLPSVASLEWEKGLLAAALGLPVYYFIALQGAGS